MTMLRSTSAQENGAIEYAENSTDPVATYTAVDPEQTAIVSWTLAGTDAGVFDIGGGVLTFKKSPDYEKPGDVMGISPSTAAVTDNLYEVTVQATDSTSKMGSKNVVVEVTNVEEAGTVALSALRPQSATMFTATLTDPDNITTDDATGEITTGVTWQWAKASSRNGAYSDIEDAESGSYEPVDGDIGSYLRATASYTDEEGSDKSAKAMSEYAVQAVRGSNNAPVFPDQDPDTDDDQSDTTTREVPENTSAGTAIGDPVVAEDKDGDVLTYTLGGNAAESFTIDWATGQLMTKAALNFEMGPTYTATVTATDPSAVPAVQTSATDSSDTITVTITVTDVNEPPAFTGGDAEVTFGEVSGDIATLLGTYVATDPEMDDPITWSVTGADAGKFSITDGVLKFRAEPDYEAQGDANGDNVYEVTVVATDSNGNRKTKDVEVKVMNEDEDGTVTLSRTQPRVGVPVTASVTDPDESISGLRWQWYNNTVGGDLTQNAIEDATSDTYTPTAADEEDDVTLRARASYTDGQGSGKSAVGEAANEVAVDTRNKPPAFEDQDTETDGDQSESTTRKVEENTKALAGDDPATESDVTSDNVGSQVTATDPDPNEDRLIYTLSGADASLFRVRDNGQIEVGAGTKLDYETKQTYMVTLTAEDSFGASDSIMVTITVTDMDEDPDVSGDAAIEYDENGAGQVARYTAVDPEQTAIVSWTLAGTDASLFSIEGGALTFKKSPDYEKPGDILGIGPSTAAATDNLYEVTVQATDSTSKMGTKNVVVEVTNVEEAGTVALSALRPQSATMFTATLTDPDNITTDNATGEITTGVTWQWAKASSRNGAYSDIEDAESGSYEPVDGDIGSYLRATASYTDEEGSDKSAKAMSEYAVQGVRGSNSATAPEFAGDQDPNMDGDQAVAVREVPESTPAGMTIGDPVVAEDKDGDVLTYTLTGTDAESFTIDWATGQLKTKASLDEETKSSYTVTVRATDPAGIPQAADGDRKDANSGIVTVTITVTDVNEPPAFTGGDAEVTFEEVDGDIATELDTYMATDPENNTPITWSVTGADAGKFSITDGVLKFRAKPDYEAQGDANGDNVYEVTVVATDSNGNRKTKDVEVKVMNEDEDGTVTLSRTKPRVGVPVTASVTDPDESISGLRWQWYNNTVGGDLTQNAIEDATSDTYTPTAADEEDDVTLRARASYTDGQGSGKSAVGEAANEVVVDTRNKPPAFEDQDTETDGDQSESTTRKVEENTEALAGAVNTEDADDDALDTDNSADNVGSAVMATDPDPNADPLIYTLSGADASLFRVRDNGQIEVGAGTKLDYETKQTYMVTLTAEDSFDASDSITVTIMVTDMDEAPKISEGGLAIAGPASVSYAEDRRDAVATYSATGPESANTSWALSGDDAGDFTISSSGELTFVRGTDYENAADANGDNEYLVTVEADDDTYTATRNVVVTVTDVEEAVIDDPLLDNLLAKFDTNPQNGQIDKSEVVDAIIAFVTPAAIDKPSKKDIVDLIVHFVTTPR